jgi:hypothetical protein
MLPSSSVSKNRPIKNKHEARSQRSYLATCFMLVSHLAFFPTQKMDTTCSIKRLVGSQGLHDVIPQKIRPFPHIKFWTSLRTFHGYHIGVIDGNKLKDINWEQAYSTMLFILSFMKIYYLNKNLLKGAEIWKKKIISISSLTKCWLNMKLVNKTDTFFHVPEFYCVLCSHK